MNEIVSVIDVGSNSIRLAAYALGRRANSIAGEPYTELMSKKYMTGLAAYVDSDGKLSDEGIDAAVAAISHLHAIDVNLGIVREHVFATASLRNVANSEYAVDQIQRRTGLFVEVVSEVDEAALGYASVRKRVGNARGLMTDIGGGSSELVEFDQGASLRMTSLAMGSLRLYKREVADVLPTSREIAAMRAFVDKRLGSKKLDKWADVADVYAMGGSARAARKLMTLHSGGDRADVTLPEFTDFVEQVFSDKDVAKQVILRACPDRVHTVIPGILILEGICKRFGALTLHIVPSSVREGYVISRLADF